MFAVYSLSCTQQHQLTPLLLLISASRKYIQNSYVFKDYRGMYANEISFSKIEYLDGSEVLDLLGPLLWHSLAQSLRGCSCVSGKKKTLHPWGEHSPSGCPRFSALHKKKTSSPLMTWSSAWQREPGRCWKTRGMGRRTGVSLGPVKSERSEPEDCKTTNRV